MSYYILRGGNRGKWKFKASELESPIDLGGSISCFNDFSLTFLLKRSVPKSLKFV